MDLYEDMSALRAAQVRNLGRHQQTAPADPEGRSKPPQLWLYRLAVVALVLFCFLLIILIIALRAAASVQTNPPSNLEQALEHGWSYFNYSLYYLSDECLTWDMAREECKKRNAELVSLNSKEELEFIQHLLKDQAWVGLTNMYSELQWVDGTAETGTFWERSLCVSECMIILKYETKLSKHPCTDKNTWICEKLVYRR